MPELNWSDILAAAGIPDSPGRAEAAQATHASVAAKRQAAADAFKAKAAQPPNQKRR